MPTTPGAWVLYVLGYYVVSRVLLVLDDVFVLRVHPSDMGGELFSQPNRNWWNDTAFTAVVFYAVPFIGDVLLLGMLIRTIPELFGRIGRRLWAYRVARDAQAEEAAARAARVEAAVAQAKIAAEREVNAALVAEFGPRFDGERQGQA